MGEAVPRFIPGLNCSKAIYQIHVSLVVKFPCGSNVLFYCTFSLASATGGGGGTGIGTEWKWIGETVSTPMIVHLFQRDSTLYLYCKLQGLHGSIARSKLSSHPLQSQLKRTN